MTGRPRGPGKPDVSVVVIAYNDAARLPVAVRSVLDQSLRGVETIIVDDASTDGTWEVARELAAAHPGRIHAIRLPVNSGGCGRPRNIGVEHAHGAYVMFLDSDDVLDRHACRNLFAAAAETGADLAAGRCVRLNLDQSPPKERAWYPWLYNRRAVLDSILERPDLLYDTLATNKCYRRAFLTGSAGGPGLRFPEDVHYEDLLFSAQAYLAANRITLIPHRVYTWHCAPRAQQRSITNRRSELRNFADRLEVHRRIDALLHDRDAGELKLIKDAKFVNHDLVLYLRELRTRDPAYRERFLELAGAYVAELDLRVFERANPMPAIAAFLVVRSDLQGALAAAEYGRTKVPELRIELRELDGRIYWGGRHLDCELGRQVLDVTELGIHLLPLTSLRPSGTVTTARQVGATVLLAGWVDLPPGRVAPDAELSGVLELADRRHSGRVMRVPAELTRELTPDGDRIGWRAGFSPVRRLRPIGFVDPIWDLRIRLTVDGEQVLCRPGPPPGGVPALPVRPRLTRLAGDRLEPYVTGWEHVSFRLTARTPWSQAARMAVRHVAANGACRLVWRRIRAGERYARRTLTARRTKHAVFNRVLTRLPVRKGTVVFESHLGEHYCDNPRYIYEELRRSSGESVRAIWSYARSPRGFPKDATLVRRGSWAYYLALARAEFWVDNQGFPEGLRKRRGTTYIQTWHGSAFKRMGLDQPALKNAGPDAQRRLRQMVDRFDVFLTRSEHDTATLARALGVDQAKLLPVGYPRNDPLVNADGSAGAQTAALRRKLDLDGRTVVLYAPTFRSDRKGRPVKRLELPFDPLRFAAEFGDTHVLLVRPHYLSTVALPPAARHAVRDVGRLPDVTPLLLLADVLVTDYSSIMFDYALLDRPMIFYVPDVEDYGRDRGGYFDLARTVPGPVLTGEDELLAALADLPGLRARYAGRRREFTARYGEYDQGGAARAVVSRFFAADLPGVRDG
jgi:CDP-glycerol glycerophosphotransferase